MFPASSVGAGEVCCPRGLGLPEAPLGQRLSRAQGAPWQRPSLSDSANHLRGNRGNQVGKHGGKMEGDFFSSSGLLNSYIDMAPFGDGRHVFKARLPLFFIFPTVKKLLKKTKTSMKNW